MLCDMYAYWLGIGQVIVSGHVIVLCSIQHVTRHMIGQVPGQVLGHMAWKEVGGHMRVSQDHVVR